MVHHSVMLPTFGSGNGKLIFLCLLNGVQNLLYCFSMLKKVANFFFKKKSVFLSARADSSNVC